MPERLKGANMLKLIAAACAALALAAPAAGQNILQKAQKAQEQKDQQQKAQEQQAAAKKGPEGPHMKKARATCNAKADGQKLKGEARRRYMADCVKT
jgi:Ni/Co efflux regulator RcnB